MTDGPLDAAQDTPNAGPLDAAQVILEAIAPGNRFAHSLGGFASFCETHERTGGITAGDLSMLAGKFRDAAFVVEQLQKRAADAETAAAALSQQLSEARAERLYDADAFMADGEITMTAAEAVLAHLLINKLGLYDGQNYTPNAAQQNLEAVIDYARKAEAAELALSKRDARPGHGDFLMADVNITPKIRCDNCGFVAEKNRSGTSFLRPGLWGSLKAEGGRVTDSYGGKERAGFTDLCPQCAEAALVAATDALKARRSKDTGEDK